MAQYLRRGNCWNAKLMMTDDITNDTNVTAALAYLDNNVP